MKIYIFADMEGCSGISGSDFISGARPEFIAMGRRFMVGDLNACIAGCFDAGATEVLVRDGHSTGLNFDPSELDPRAELIQGATPGVRFVDLDGAEGMILLGYHAMAGTEGAVLEHSYSSRTIQNLRLNDRKIGEIGLDAAIAAEHNVPVILVTGDDKACGEAVRQLPGVLTCTVKKGLGTQAARLLAPETARSMIRARTIEAIRRRDKVALFRPEYPATLSWEYMERVPVPRDSRFTVIDGRTCARTGGSVEELLVR